MFCNFRWDDTRACRALSAIHSISNSGRARQRRRVRGVARAGRVGTTSSAVLAHQSQRGITTPRLLHIVVDWRIRPLSDRLTRNVGRCRVVVTQGRPGSGRNLWPEPLKNPVERACTIGSGSVRFLALTQYLVGAVRWGYKIVRCWRHCKAPEEEQPVDKVWASCGCERCSPHGLWLWLLMTVRRPWRKDFRELAKLFGGAQTTTIYSAFGMCCA